MLTTKNLLMLFVERELLKEDKIEEILEKSELQNSSVDKYMLNQRYITEENLLKVVAEELDYSLIESLGQVSVPEYFRQKIPMNYAMSTNMVGTGEQDGRYQVATSTPFDIPAQDELSALLESEIDLVLAPRGEIQKLIQNAYSKTSAFDETGEVGLDDDELDEENPDRHDITGHIGYDKPFVIKSVNNIILQALRQRVSDIHLQPYEEKLQVRFRIDGILYETQSLPKRYKESIISRIKVMGKMDIAEKRLPQDGRISITLGDSEVDLRISSVPTSWGERIVMRILDKSARVFELSSIGLHERDFKLIDYYIHQNHGIILVTGPTGSGKSTTLYSSLTRLNSIEKNIMTVEDPVEYQLDSISQINVAAKRGLTFAQGLRTLLRQDPDVIMVGEIRDEETARIAIQAALTGHLVLSTLHTNDSASAVTRLVDIGIEPYLVSSSLLGVVAQRLVRKICENCKIQYVPEEDELIGADLDKNILKESDGFLWKGEGCDQCMQSGYLDRCGIYEVLAINERIRGEVVQRKPASIIKKGAVEEGLRTLRVDAIGKMLQGICSLEEMLRVTQVDH